MDYRADHQQGAQGAQGDDSTPEIQGRARYSRSWAAESERPLVQNTRQHSAALHSTTQHYTHHVTTLDSPSDGWHSAPRSQAPNVRLRPGLPLALLAVDPLVPLQVCKPRCRLAGCRLRRSTDAFGSPALRPPPIPPSRPRPRPRPRPRFPATETARDRQSLVQLGLVDGSVLPACLLCVAASMTLQASPVHPHSSLVSPRTHLRLRPLSAAPASSTPAHSL